jgi:hypothetical protein
MPGNLPPDPESVSNGQLYMLVEQLRHQLQTDREQSAIERAVLTKRVDDLIGEVAMSRKESSEMVDLWKSGKTIVAVVKIAGMLATALLAMWGLVSLLKGAPVAPSEVIGLVRRE